MERLSRMTERSSFATSLTASSPLVASPSCFAANYPFPQVFVEQAFHGTAKCFRIVRDQDSNFATFSYSNLREHVSQHRTNTVTIRSIEHLASYSCRNRRMRGDKLTSTHFEHGHLKAESFGKAIWPQFLQIKRPSETCVIKWNFSSTTQ